VIAKRSGGQVGEWLITPNCGHMSMLYCCIVMDNEQLAKLWAFARGDATIADVERWFYEQHGVESALGRELHWALLSGNYAKKDEVWALREAVRAVLTPIKSCECLSLRDLAVVPMGGDGLDERVFATVRRVCDHGGQQWWLYLAKCASCGQYWMVAQEERIFDDYFLRRLDSIIAIKIVTSREWPSEFLTYELVLTVGRKLSQPCRFMDALAPSLVWTAADLRKERPDISVEEIAYLMGITPAHAVRLLVASFLCALTRVEWFTRRLKWLLTPKIGR